ncbi:MAG: hypothetical protein COV35_00375 [Alphaproteobacteria bacterium CG11_big_fil_rev_8_21_14_0_20_39_49]|nr:MAG: hypothetical protein COV35_00375 [Alphaproteobacteria bacterium CG11_big_fil_rev_8_21_14_0_20_39_49]
MEKEKTTFRLDAAARRKAYEGLYQIDIKPNDAVNMFMHYIATFGELPFKPNIPNKETLETFKKTDEDQDLTHHNRVSDI